MPFVDLLSTDDFASIYYTTNSVFGNVGGFDPEKPTVCILHPTFLDSSWLYPQFNDPRLDSEYNLIAFDMRVSGKSECRHSGRHDSWVDAADLAYCAQVCFCAPENRVPLELTFSLPSRSRLAPPPIPLPHPRYGEHLHKLRPQICCAVSFSNIWVYYASSL
jgi:hypothetical protein